MSSQQSNIIDDNQSTMKKHDKNSQISHHHKKNLASQPEEIIEQIFEFIPRDEIIRVSGTCQQFRRLWKESPHGIVFNMIIQLNYSFQKYSYSLNDEIELGIYTKETISRMICKKEKERQQLFNLEKKDRLLTKLSGKENISENFNKAIKLITRFDYEEIEREHNNSPCYARGFEIEFGQLGMMQLWKWNYLREDHSELSAKMSEKLKSLNLTEDEWDFIIKMACNYINLSRVDLDDFYYQEIRESIFKDHYIMTKPIISFRF
ncbi:Hypothetical protein NAEGRDRAFT_64435 [Naegleria gruberi]|uniref:F-box domain-containing protein n=1 Tax=Naegleria gruberi TaxID=5762 RepID=D2V6H0_NAEGR|nr:uncharacterized protein NAEGRDRAFT_64435 [Naegleria gruberi]EFC47445.1 Hypothetical protein NAEGRDRAFT_64435 [Naegleria gruberi]|eukprot:XP_002680189.1 Hypothetical protein NAEGRDRAFT_64435 [Naegleria gruberi strain NEG-M]